MARTDDLTNFIFQHDKQIDSINISISQLNQQLAALGIILNAIVANSDYEASTSAAEKTVVVDNLEDITPISVVLEKII